MDLTANQLLAAKDIDSPVEPASLTKLMTQYLVFDALKAKKIDIKQDLACERARLAHARLAHVHRPQDEGAGGRPDQGHGRAVGQRRHSGPGRGCGRVGRAVCGSS
jgi:hypothetical protein